MLNVTSFWKVLSREFLPGVGVVCSSVVLSTLGLDGLDGHVINSLGVMKRTMRAKRKKREIFRGLNVDQFNRSFFALTIIAIVFR